MALSATIFKAQLSLADMDRHHYQDYRLTVARHPSENDERMMQRVLCFAMYAGDGLEFTRGLSTDDEPDLWQKTLAGDIKHWIDLGQPDEKRLRRACGRARAVTVHCYSGHSARLWFDKSRPQLSRFEHLRVVNIEPEQCAELAQLAARNMTLQVSIEDAQIYVSDADRSVLVTPTIWFGDARA